MAKAAQAKPRAGTPRLRALAVFVLVALVTGWLGSLPTQPALEAWYPALQKPAFTPPNAVFPVVWAVLYVVMGCAAWLTWIAPGSVVRNTALVAFFVQLALNAGWSWVFFGLRDLDLALAVIVALIVAIAVLILAAWRIARVAAILLVPYLGWVAYAAVLNATIAFQN